MAQNPVHRRTVVRGSIHTEPDNTALAEECAVRGLSRLSSLVVVVCGSVNMAQKLFASVRQVRSQCEFAGTTNITAVDGTAASHAGAGFGVRLARL
jgi:hypothetical protein